MASEAKEIIGFRPAKSGLYPLDTTHDADLAALATAEGDPKGIGDRVAIRSCASI